jgi:hypothetical protein
MNAAGDWYTGNLDEVSIWNKTLSPAEVANIYNSGSPADLAQHSAAANLVGWWRMGDGDTYPTLLDHGTGGVPYPLVRDVSGHNLNGTMTSMEVTDIQLNAPYGKAVTFDGVNEYVTMGNVLGFEYNTPFSVGFWFRTTTSLTTATFAVAKQGDASAYRGWAIFLRNGAINFYLSNTYPSQYASLYTTSTFNDDVWHYCVCTYSAATPGAVSDMKIVIDGVEQTTTTEADTLGAQTIITTASFNIGARTDGVKPWAGSLDEVTIWNKKLLSGEVSELYNGGALPVDPIQTSMAANLIGWWPMGERDVFPTLTDRSSGGHNGTMVNMESTDIVDCALVAANAFSKKSLIFDGSESIWCGSILNYERTDSFSVSVWFKINDTSVRMILGKNGTNYQGYSIYTQGGIRVEIISSWSGNWLQGYTSTSWADNRWHHLVVTYDGTSLVSGLKIYIDGNSQTVSVGANSLTGSIVTSAEFKIGERTSGFPFVGSLDDLAFYNKVLSVAEVLEVYHQGIPTDLRLLSTGGNLDAYWRLGDSVPNPGTMTNMEAGDIQATAPGSGPITVDVSDALASVYEVVAGLPETVALSEAHTDLQGFGVPAPETVSVSEGLNSLVHATVGGGYSVYSVLFDGVNEYVTMGNALAFERTNAFSASVWIKTTSTTYGYILSKSEGSTTFRGYALFLNSDGSFSFALRNTTVVPINQIYVTSSVTGKNDGLWHHLIVTYDGSSIASHVKFYIDGVLVGTTVNGNTLTDTILNTASFNVSGRTDGSGPIAGRLDEISVWGRELSLSDVTSIYNSGQPNDLSVHSAVSDLVGWWRMGEDLSFPTIPDLGTGGVPYPLVRDVSGNAYNGTMANMEASDVVPDVPYAKYVVFDGVSDYIGGMGNVLGFDIADSFSVGAWVKDIGNNGYIIAKADAVVYGWGLTGRDNSFEFRMLRGVGHDMVVKSLINLNDGNWHFILATYDGTMVASGVTLYVDGVEDTSSVITSDTIDGSILNSANLNIGARNDGSSSFSGKISVAAVWNKELSSGEITAIQALAHPTDLSLPSSASNLVGWWRLGWEVYPTVRDSSNSGYHGTMTNMSAAVIQDFDITLTPKYVLFEGTNEYVTMGDVLGYERTSPFSFSCWFRSTSTASESDLVSKALGSGTWRGYDL